MSLSESPSPAAASPLEAQVPPLPRPPRAARLHKQQLILAEAERQFARLGLEGVSLDSIATALGISRQNMLYYYGTKDELYDAVLDNVLQSWVQNMDDMARAEEPEAAVRNYVQAKLRFSQQRPWGSAVFTREVMAGAPRFGPRLSQAVMPRLREDVATFERWAREGRIRSVNFTHLMFVIWSATQAYADQAPQFALFMDKPALDEGDFEAAHALISDMVWCTLRQPG